jgi:hypothetical protein
MGGSCGVCSRSVCGATFDHKVFQFGQCLLTARDRLRRRRALTASSEKAPASNFGPTHSRIFSNSSCDGSLTEFPASPCIRLCRRSLRAGNCAHHQQHMDIVFLGRTAQLLLIERNAASNLPCHRYRLFAILALAAHMQEELQFPFGYFRLNRIQGLFFRIAGLERQTHANGNLPIPWQFAGCDEVA